MVVLKATAMAALGIFIQAELASTEKLPTFEHSDGQLDNVDNFEEDERVANNLVAARKKNLETLIITINLLKHLFDPSITEPNQDIIRSMKKVQGGGNWKETKRREREENDGNIKYLPHAQEQEQEQRENKKNKMEEKQMREQREWRKKMLSRMG